MSPPIDPEAKALQAIRHMLAHVLDDVVDYQLTASALHLRIALMEIDERLSLLNKEMNVEPSIEQQRDRA
ncbi:MAG: hypothetical protein AAGF15_01415 [Pseudomonadota bacterium]